MAPLTRLLYLPERRDPVAEAVDPGAITLGDLDRLVGGLATEVPALTRIHHEGSAVRCRAFVEAEAGGLDLPENRAVMAAWRLVDEPGIEPLRGPVVVLIADAETLEALDALGAA